MTTGKAFLNNTCEELRTRWWPDPLEHFCCCEANIDNSKPSGRNTKMGATNMPQIPPNFRHKSQIAFH